MSFKVFAVVLLEPNDEVAGRIDERYEESFEFNETFYLIKCPRTVMSHEVAEVIGFKGEAQIEGASGFVIQQRPAYSGYTRRDLWEWLGSLTDDWGGED